MEIRHQTKAQLAANFLRDMIQRGELPPGALIDIEALGQRLDMSATPIREALRSLVAEGLTVGESHRRMRVAVLSAAEASATYELRALLESYATRLAVPSLTKADIRQLERLLRLRRNALDRGDVGAAIRLHKEWHFQIYSVAGHHSPHLQEFIERLWNLFPWTTSWAVPWLDDTKSMSTVRPTPDMRGAQSEQDPPRGDRGRSLVDHAEQVDHADIMAAITAGDATLAGGRMDAHIQRPRDFVVDSLQRAGSDGDRRSEATAPAIQPAIKRESRKSPVTSQP